jgi:hypothetical protein
MALPAVRSHGARTTCPTTRSAGSYWVAMARRKRPRRGETGTVRLKPWPARWRNDAVPQASGPVRTWHWWLVRNLTAYTGACACSEAQARERVASARGCTTSTVDKRRAARRHGWGGHCRREATCASMRTGVRAQERPGARTTRWKDTTEGGASARRGRRPASSSRSRNIENKGQAFSLPRRTCARAGVHGRVGMSEGVCVRASRP